MMVCRLYRCAWAVGLSAVLAGTVPSALSVQGRLKAPKRVRFRGAPDRSLAYLKRHTFEVAISPFRVQIEAPSRVAVASADGVSAAAGSGTTVYQNFNTDPQGAFPHRPGAGQRMADDLFLVNGGCTVVSYSLVIGGSVSSSTFVAFSAEVALWDDDPCNAGAAMIPGSSATLTGVDGEPIAAHTVTLTAPAAVPGTVWMSAEFANDTGTWLVAERAEVGFTGNFFSEDNTDLLGSPPDPETIGCRQFRFGGDNPPYAGFWATVECDITDPLGACCSAADDTCAETTESECAGGGWQDAFSPCEPSPCVTGTCCSGIDFTNCVGSTEADCVGEQGLFRPGDGCPEDPCPQTFKIFENTFNSGSFTALQLGTIWADDLKLGPGGPCTLLAYDVTTASDLGAPPYTVDVALWSNDDGGTPNVLTDDIPAALIAGTETTFVNVPGNQSAERLLAGPFDGVVLPERVWLVISTDTDEAGPALAGVATIGVSEDALAAFDFPTTTGVWERLNSPLMDPLIGSFEINVWCAGEGPSGACCDDDSGACLDGLKRDECDGRWVAGAACDDQPFSPPCGTGACCVNDPIPGCLPNPKTPSECRRFDGVVAVGSLCEEITCPRASCFSATGDCLTGHATTGCDEPTCCEKVCNQESACCDMAWDADPCAALAASLCEAPPACPDATQTLTFEDPSDGWIDARQPYAPLGSDSLQGVDSFLVRASDDVSNLRCWSLCESSFDLECNKVTSVIDHGDGTFTVRLLQAITANAATSLTYRTDDSLALTGTFTSHAANVDGSELADTEDVQHLLDCITSPGSCELSRCDMNRSGRCTPADLLRMIDLLKGVDDFLTGTLDTLLPVLPACCDCDPCR